MKITTAVFMIAALGMILYGWFAVSPISVQVGYISAVVGGVLVFIIQLRGPKL